MKISRFVTNQIQKKKKSIQMPSDWEELERMTILSIGDDMENELTRTDTVRIN